HAARAQRRAPPLFTATLFTAPFARWASGVRLRPKAKARDVDPISQALRVALANFKDEVNKPEEELDLTRAAALLALHADPTVDLEAKVFQPLKRLREGFLRRADELRSFSVGEPSPEALAAALCAHLTAEGFEGCSRTPEDFYRAELSLLHHVLESRRGIPISLAVVYREVAGDLLELWGANFPGHFLLGFGRGDAAGLVDAFAGTCAAAPRCEELLSDAFGRPSRLAPGWAHPLPSRALLRRMVRNLEPFARG
ncbi:unnamed protein product, partial [Effrenium voratum]